MSEEILNDCLDENQKITDEVILELKPLAFYTISNIDIIDFIHSQCQKVLEIAQQKNDSKEVARAVNLDTFEVLLPVFGEAHRVDIDYLVDQMKGTDYAFLVMHNHPSNSHFSEKDIKTFVDAVNMSILIVLGNNGAIYILEKTRDLLPNEIISARKTLLDWKKDFISYDTVIEQIKAFGIVHSEI
ncbi:hypothetical protein [Butyrivibrio hungatei]|uniref:hypothetical protein n=2 Tax=Butyrivibrio TaxID=830 RepID=UPI0003FF7436|nr:hypothetical protein [Butyrivibrio hungatei]